MKTAPLPELARRLRNDENLFMAWCGMNDAAIAETLAREKFDTILLDMQHGALDFSTTLEAIALVGLVGKPAIVAPMVNSAEDAKKFASYVKFPPLGERSWGPGRALGLSGLDSAAYFKQANAMHLAIAMIETREALAELDAILSTPSIDGVLVGLADLSIALTNGAGVDQTAPVVEQALDHIVARCKSHQKYASLFCATGKRAHAMSLRGFQLCSVATDAAMLRNAAQAELAQARNSA